MFTVISLYHSYNIGKIKYEAKKENLLPMVYLMTTANVGTTSGIGGNNKDKVVPSFAEIILPDFLPIPHLFCHACPNCPTGFPLLCAPKRLTPLSTHFSS